MKVSFYIDTSIKEQDFTAERELSEEEYVEMLRNYSKTLDYGIDKFAESRSIGRRYSIQDCEKVEEPSKESLKFVQSKATIYDINGVSMCLDELNFLADIEDMFVAIVHIDEMSDDLFESEIRYWAKESMNIKNDKYISEDDKIKYLPVKTLKIDCGEGNVFYMEGCKMYEEYSPVQYAFIIKKLTKK